MAEIDSDFYVHSSKIAGASPAIYCLVSLQVRCIYVGQTNSKLGVLGRFAQHLSNSESNTFKQRVFSIYKYEDIELENIRGTYFCLPRENRFLNNATDYRDAVEALTQDKIIPVAASMGMSVISRVQKNPQCSLDDIKLLSEIAAKKFEGFIRKQQSAD